MNYLVTRHLGTRQWLKERISDEVIHLSHLDNPECLMRGDVVIGVLPIKMVAEICILGAFYLNIEIDIPRNLRGQELTAQQIERLGAKLVEYRAQKHNSDQILIETRKNIEFRQ